ncbi:Bud-site selection protein [Hyaloscypha finlandica]|nr:Bud-site selection protein [Hyaloscypha finlandica]
MPKRKRSTYDDGDRVQNMRMQDAQDALTKARKQLHRALKTAKGFERQKLGKRLKLATTNGESEAIARINREIEALKGLDLGNLTNTHLQKSLLKIKAFAESETLPNELKMELPKPEGDEAMLTALRNVTSGMYSMKPVKDAMDQNINGMYIAMGIPAPAKKEKGAKKGEVKGVLKKGGLSASAIVGDVDIDQKEESRSGDDGLPWEGFDSREDDEDKHEEKGGVEDESMDEEELARYDALLGGSSDEESFDEERYTRNRPPQTAKRVSLSLSPTPSASPTPSQSASPSLSSSPEPEQTKTSKPSKAKGVLTTKPGLSTFLPTLIGGYWSGSESSASDIEDAAPIKKNRPGQTARRAIWEKKYGEKANHIKTGKGPVGRGKDDGWDAKRGAKESSSGRGSFSGRGGRGGREGGRTRSYDQATGENAIAVEPKKRGMGRKDDVGVLHPSWQAAKKAKEAKKTATFQGKKVTFD